MFVLKQKQTHRLENEPAVTGGEGWRGGTVGVWDGHAHRAVLKTGNQQGPARQHREPGSVLCTQYCVTIQTVKEFKSRHVHD